MGEREPQHETISRGELLYLWHPNTDEIFSGYGLTLEPHRPELLVGLLMVDRPTLADEDWLQSVVNIFGECELIPMTKTGERGLACRMEIEPESVLFLRSLPSPRSGAIQRVLQPLLEEPPAPSLRLKWSEQAQVWTSEFNVENVLPFEIRQVFERTGYGCLAAESDIGVVHICHAPDVDIEGFRDKPVVYQWQLINMPTAPLIRLEVRILDNTLNPFRFESFLNTADADQAKILDDLANQDQLYLAFYGDDLTYRYTKLLRHDDQQWQNLDEIVAEAHRHWTQIPPDISNFDHAKEEFIRLSETTGL